MILIFELSLFVIGIVILVRGRIQLTQKTVVVGPPASAIGVILVTSLPAMFFADRTFPALDQALFGGVPNPAALYLWFKLFLILGIVAIVIAIALIAGKPHGETS